MIIFLDGCALATARTRTVGGNLPVTAAAPRLAGAREAWRPSRCCTLRDRRTSLGDRSPPPSGAKLSAPLVTMTWHAASPGELASIAES